MPNPEPSQDSCRRLPLVVALLFVAAAVLLLAAVGHLALLGPPGVVRRTRLLLELVDDLGGDVLAAQPHVVPALTEALVPADPAHEVLLVPVARALIEIRFCLLYSDAEKRCNKLLHKSVVFKN